MTELKNLQAAGLTTLGVALKSAFDLLNINRMQTGIDMYGQGRYPYYLEPAVIVCITDGGKLSSNAGVQEDVSTSIANKPRFLNFVYLLSSSVTGEVANDLP